LFCISFFIFQFAKLSTKPQSKICAVASATVS
jgi:hypothetical protein